MTLSTDIYVHGTGVTHREVFDKVNELLGIPTPREIEEGPNEYDYRPDFEISNAPGQGFPAWVMSHANADGSEYTPANDADGAYAVPAYHVHVDLDTAYGYRDDQGRGCAELHGWVIAALIDWLEPKGCTLHWADEYAGTLHEGKDHLDAFLGHGVEATEWFTTRVLPAIFAEAVRPS